jgi:hypothetical protein
MSRVTLFQNDRLTLVGGTDHMLGSFLQLYDKEMVDETPEGEGLVFDWSMGFGIETNLTGISGKNINPETIVNQYILENSVNLN